MCTTATTGRAGKWPTTKHVSALQSRLYGYRSSRKVIGFHYLVRFVQLHQFIQSFLSHLQVLFQRNITFLQNIIIIHLQQEIIEMQINIIKQYSQKNNKWISLRAQPTSQLWFNQRKSLTLICQSWHACLNRTCSIVAFTLLQRNKFKFGLELPTTQEVSCSKLRCLLASSVFYKVHSVARFGGCVVGIFIDEVTYNLLWWKNAKIKD